MTAEGRSWNNIVDAGSSVTLGFCAAREAEPVAACADGVDNDADGLVDFPADPGCADADDDDEYNEPLPACSDGIDNDGDELIDYPNDPGCESTSDDDEYDEIIPVFQCGDGIDNDGDGLVDFPDDPGCDNADDDDEFNAPPSGDDLTLTTTITSDWGSGYCADVIVHNNAAAAIDWVVSFEVDGRITTLWNGSFGQEGSQATVEGAHWNDLVAAGGSVSFGFCAGR